MVWTKEKAKAYMAEYRKKHRKELLARAREYAKTHADKRKAYFDKWYKKNKKQYNAERALRLKQSKGGKDGGKKA